MKYTYKQLAKAVKHEGKKLELLGRLAVLGDCATQMLVNSIKGYSLLQGYRIEIFEADYNQIEFELRESDSKFHRFKADYVFLCMTTMCLYEAFCDTPLEKRENFAEATIGRITEYWEKAFPAKVLFSVFPEMDDRIFGNFAGKISISFIYQLRKLNLLIMEESQKTKNLYLIEYPFQQNQMGYMNTEDNKLKYMARMPFSLEILPEFAKNVFDVILALKGKVKKCVVLDLDGTLWGGTIGEDGLKGIQIGELGVGRAFSDFQRWLRELKRRGVLLAVCSKNDEEKAKEPFLKHPDMLLRLEDISVFVANWENKASNIKGIQEILNIGLDSFVFLDDNSFERNLIRELLPEVTVPELPEDPAFYVSFLKQENIFETVSYSDEDISRTEQYQTEQKRVVLQKSSVSLDEYLESLEMTANCKAFDSFYFPRIAQLTQRSNQFNLRTIRYTEDEIAEVSSNSDYITRYITLQDRFGDYGLISVIIMKKASRDTLFIDTWLMSCRVLKRGVEEYAINSMIKAAEENGFQYIIGEYIPTKKNSMVRDIYGKNGFQILGDGRFQADTKTWEKLPTHIR